MSAKGRTKKKGEGEQTVRETLDHYSTPAWTTRALVERIGFDLRGKTVLECAAGEGAMVDVLVDAGAVVDAVEIDSGRAALIRSQGKARRVVCANFLGAVAGIEPAYDVVISNPPYGEKLEGKKYRDLALEFAEKAIKLAPVVAFLLRINWAGSGTRHAFHVKHPADLVVLVNRPKFKGKGSDATEYAWWIWRRGATVGTWVTHLAADAPGRGRPKAPKPKAPRAKKPAAEPVAEAAAQ